MPCLNQRAREVPPFRSSLASSSIFLLVSKMRLIFWIGHDFYDCYLDQDTYNKQSALIHEDLLNKVLYIYEQSTTEGEVTSLLTTVKKKAYYTVEGTDDNLNEYIDGERVQSSMQEDEELMADFESPMVQEYHPP